MVAGSATTRQCYHYQCQCCKLFSTHLAFRVCLRSIQCWAVALFTIGPDVKPVITFFIEGAMPALNSENVQNFQINYQLINLLQKPATAGDIVVSPLKITLIVMEDWRDIVEQLAMMACLSSNLFQNYYCNSIQYTSKVEVATRKASDFDYF